MNTTQTSNETEGTSNGSDAQSGHRKGHRWVFFRRLPFDCYRNLLVCCLHGKQNHLFYFTSCWSFFFAMSFFLFERENFIFKLRQKFTLNEIEEDIANIHLPAAPFIIFRQHNWTSLIDLTEKTKLNKVFFFVF